MLTSRWLGAGRGDTVAVALFLLCSGCLSILLGWAILLRAWHRRIGLRLALIAIGALGPFFVLANVAFTARLMVPLVARPGACSSSSSAFR